MMTLGESLKRFRKTYNLTQKQVANELGIFPQMFQTYESDKKVPAATVLINMAKKFNVSLDYLAGLSDDPNRTLKTTVLSADIDDNKDLITAAENDRVLDFYENLAHKLAEQGIKI